ncbi:MAG: alpha-amylase [Candidatus Rokubacteria bacterium]|nr:alpha-amylase [Candidatus Rokubacteria bacterium]
MAQGWPQHPLVYEINTWVWLNALGRAAGRAITLADVPEDELARIADLRFDAVWLMGVWERSPGAREVSRTLCNLQEEYRRALPDYTRDDVVGSPYAVARYRVDAALGGDVGLKAFRERLAGRGLRLILDFVPNHLAIDHEWVTEAPDRLVQGDERALASATQNWFRRDVHRKVRVFAYGRDPYFDGWSDTVQIDYRRADTRRAMREILAAVAERADGARCDMAMLAVHDVFLRTWGGAFDEPGVQFWTDALASVAKDHPEFLTMAEVYWDLEWVLQGQGFDFTYDKTLYDRLVHGDARQVRAHLGGEFAYQRRLVRFIENHDEPRAMSALGPERGRAAAVIALALPGLRLVHEGQMEGWRLKLPVQLGRRHDEPTHAGLPDFYGALLRAHGDPVFHDGGWTLLEPRQAWEGNPTHDGFVLQQWSFEGESRLVAVNFAPTQGQCFVPLPMPNLGERRWKLTDALSDAEYVRDGADLAARGLYLDMPGYGAHVFTLDPA